MIVYIDVFFLINFISDLFIVCARDLFSGGKRVRKIIASLIGALYSCLYFFDIGDIFFSPGARFLVLGVMAAAVELPAGFLKILNTAVEYLIISVLPAGAVYGGYVFLNGSAPPFPMPDIIFAFGIVFSYITVRAARYILQKKALKESFRIRIYYKGKCVCTDAEVDTGNGLKDSFGYPVTVVDGRVIKKLFPNGFPASVAPEDIRVIPCRTASGEGVLFGFCPDKTFIGKKESPKMTVAASKTPVPCGALINPLSIY